MLSFREPSEYLSPDDLAQLVEENQEFDRWLKRFKKISNYDNASAVRAKRREKLRELIDKAPKPRTLQRIADGLQIALDHPEDGQIDILLDIAEFFRTRLGIDIKTKYTTSVTPPAEEEVLTPPTQAALVVTSKVIGRVAPTLRTPATPTEFTFWVEDNDNIHVETGSLVTARNQSAVRVTGLVSETQAVSDVEGVLDSFYSHGFGRPEEEMPTKLPLVMSAKVEVVRRSDGRTEPVRGTWPVTFASAQEIREAYGAEISPDHEILAGFTYDDQRYPVPIGLDTRFVIGYEAAHINIAGASGVATKTSYALFLLYSLLAYNTKHPGSVAAIAFNVKEADLMFIDQQPANWEEVKKREHHAALAPSIRLWLQARDDYGLDPIEWAQQQKFQFFAPMHYNPERGVPVLSHRCDAVVKPFNYSLTTLIESGVGSLYSLFDAQDLDEKALALIASISEEAKRGDLTFESLFRELESALKKAVPGMADWFPFGDTLHHRATARKILNRMKHTVDNQLRGVIQKSERTDQPLPISQLQPGKLWVIDITQLGDKGQRLVFQTVVRSVFQLLEERKSLELTGQLQGDLAAFPKHVVIFVDELNKFVPIGREFSALKSEIIEMAARGRSIGMSLCGAEQLASKIDEEVLANTSTFAVGRSHAIELRKTPYAWLAEGLKERAMVLDKGSMLLWHSLHKRPVLVHFPMPLHKIHEQIQQGQPL
jgi:hypothetical protein